jgi:N-acetylglucosamine-6-phosphate deacetylase
MLILTHVTLLTPAVQLEDTAVFIENGRFTHIAPTTQLPIPDHTQIIEGHGRYLVPGFIDLQLNGAFGHDFTADPATIWRVAAGLPRWGVTAFLPTIITSPPAQVQQAQEVWRHGRPANFVGATPLGLHVEGPFLNPVKKGAHNPAYLRRPTAVPPSWSPETGVRLVTLAPELPGALVLVEELASRGVVVSAGHSLATFAEAQAAFAQGVRYGTHLFNAMPPLNHRQPGLGGALLATEDVIAGIIPDGVHVHPAMVQLAWQIKGPSGLNVVSDAMAALGMSPGVYRLNEFAVTVADGQARLADGTLAGSVLDMATAVRNLITFTHCSLAEALATVTTTPADLLALSDRGRIAPGYIADAVLLDSNLVVEATIAAGQVAYWRSS